MTIKLSANRNEALKRVATRVSTMGSADKRGKGNSDRSTIGRER